MRVYASDAEKFGEAPTTPIRSPVARECGSWTSAQRGEAQGIDQRWFEQGLRRCLKCHFGDVVAHGELSFAHLGPIANMWAFALVAA